MRVLVCIDCEDEIELHEIPCEFTDPRRFRCVACLDSRHDDTRRQLELVPDADRTANPRTGPRAESRRYDPAHAVIPY